MKTSYYTFMLLISLLVIPTYLAQDKINLNAAPNYTPKAKWYNGAGIYVLGGYQLSTINVQRNPFSQTLFSGWSGGLLIRSRSNPHVLIQYGSSIKTDLSSDWINIKEQHVNVNAYFEAFSNDNNRLLTLLGLSYKNVNSFYTGTLRSSEYSNIYNSNSYVNNSWLGLNTGLGYEFDINPFSTFGLIEIPIMWSDVGFGINDFIITIGLKQKLPLGLIFKKSKDRYHWF
jgi:hypothetical protein